MPEPPFHNGLSPAETERLALLGEECSQVCKTIGKVIRHGYASRNPDVADSATNREDLEHEVGDMLWAIDLMAHCGDISMLRSRADTGRHARKKRYLHHQDAEGISRLTRNRPTRSLGKFAHAPVSPPGPSTPAR